VRAVRCFSEGVSACVAAHHPAARRPRPVTAMASAPKHSAQSLDRLVGDAACFLLSWIECRE
jgi:hypothetical protein